MMEAADMVKWRLRLEPDLYLARLTVHEYGAKVRKAWDGLRLPYFLPHVWQAMLLTLFGVSGLVGAAWALYLLKLRGLW